MSYDDPSGTGRASVLAHVRAHDKSGARWAAGLKLQHHMKNPKIERVVHLGEELDEKLDSRASASDYVRDFVHSDDPRFRGDSKKQRIRRALAAFYKKESAETEIDEAKKYRDFHYETTPGKKKRAFNLERYLDNAKKRNKKAVDTKKKIKEEYLDEGRGRPKKSGEAVEDPDEHPIVQLHKAVSLRGQHLFKFKSGKPSRVSPDEAHRALSRYSGLSDPASKMAFASRIGQSHDSLRRAVHEAKETEKTLNTRKGDH